MAAVQPEKKYKSRSIRGHVRWMLFHQIWCLKIYLEHQVVILRNNRHTERDTAWKPDDYASFICHVR